MSRTPRLTPGIAVPPLAARLLPFLRWFPLQPGQLRADVVAGITVALVLVPQSMAYAALAGLPVVYGLYAAFVPVLIGALWGSSNHLHTGPVAMISLMSAAALVPFAAVGSPEFVGLSLMLAMLVGAICLALGLLRLGVLVNFLSHPVTIGFTNAAAIIIGLSLLNRILNVPMPRSDRFLHDMWVTVSQIGHAHLPTVLFALAAAALLWASQRYLRRVPAVLAAVVIATTASWLIGFERNARVAPEAIADPQVRALVEEFIRDKERIEDNSRETARLSTELRALPGGEAGATRAIELEAEIATLRLHARQLTRQVNERRVALHRHELVRRDTPAGPQYVPAAGADGEAPHWHVTGVRDGAVTLAAGGEVVGKVPAGLPAFAVPPLRADLLLQLLPAALVIALIGFMEASLVAKSIAARTRQRLDTNQELIGQGLANLVGSLFQSYTVSGSFSRSALSVRAGARTGLFAIVSALGALVAMLFLTPLLYHLPQAVLAVIVMFAVFGLVRIEPLVHAWQVARHDAIAGIVTFVATLALAPSLATGIAVGVALTVAMFLVRTMRPRAEILGRHPDGTLGGIRSHSLKPLSENFVAVRFDGSLNFVNVSYFEDIVLEALAQYPQARAVLVIGSGINDIDASGEEKMRDLALRLRENGVTLVLSSLKKQVQDVCARSGLCEVVGPGNLFKTKELAIETMHRRYDRAAGAAS